MKTANYGDPYTKRMTLRLTEPQMEFLQKMGTIMGVSPSEYLRMAINTSMISSGKVLDDILSGDMAKNLIFGKGTEGTSNENVKTDSNNLV